MSLTLSSTATITGTNVQIPRLGFGVWQIAAANCAAACAHALNAGYRHIDTARLYRNEEQVGTAVRESGLSRADVFVTTKQGVRGDTPELTYQLALESVEKAAGTAPGAYVDLFLVHIPDVRGGADGRKEVWLALERLFREGRARAIGVSNYGVQHIEEMKTYASVWPPHVNQIELHPWWQQRELVAYCEEQGIVVQAYSPLATGTKLNDPVVGEMARSLSKSPAQVLIRYGLQRGWVVLPKSENPERIRQNADVFDFELGQDDLRVLDGLDGLDGQY
ncbi:putative aldo-keto reductase [Lasiosphaeria miniovina]|uniref:Aldo-keto reductase n=1 Tax=Lasiosphaeria miniovina TaxID=1954250 RepID=A0AA40AMB1_9PEZI|nr:putative aldo-keto reductase [Lasiosphaeria miniovina]KAK0718493.1 putative aldo-keto reductase [Lasiosphaeria miniovina]